MELRVRAARADDSSAPGLLYMSAAPYYDAYAGSGERARRVLQAIWPKPGHTASHQVAHVAVLDGAPAGVLVAFPSEAGDALARRFLSLSIVRIPAWRWPGIVRHLRASAEVTPNPPAGTLYVDALAVADHARRRGVATALLDEAEALARRRGLDAVALDTGLDNAAARALYEQAGFRVTGIRRAPDEHVAREVGGPGFVSYLRTL
jgi:ribosomal protein S18 acetylase RimI-like enzyme